MERSEAKEYKEKVIYNYRLRSYYIFSIEEIFPPDIDRNDAFNNYNTDREHKLFKQAYIYCLNRHYTRTQILEITGFSKTAIQNALSKWDKYKKKGFPYKEHINKFQKVLAIPEYGK